MALQVNSKRIISFVAIILLAVFAFITDDTYAKAFYIIVIIVFVGFIIFLRNGKKTEEVIPEPTIIDKIEPPTYKPDDGESFTILNTNKGIKDIEVITQESYSQITSGTKKNSFKPPDFKENYVKIANEELPETSQKHLFNFVLDRILQIIKEFYLANSSLFFYYDPVQKKIILEKIFLFFS